MDVLGGCADTLPGTGSKDVPATTVDGFSSSTVFKATHPPCCPVASTLYMGQRASNIKWLRTSVAKKKGCSVAA